FTVLLQQFMQAAPEMVRSARSTCGLHPTLNQCSGPTSKSVGRVQTETRPSHSEPGSQWQRAPTQASASARQSQQFPSSSPVVYEETPATSRGCPEAREDRSA